MTPTQNNGNNGGSRQGQKRPPEARPPARPTDARRGQTAQGQPPRRRPPTWQYPENKPTPQTVRPRRQRREKPLTLGQALLAEVQDLGRALWLGLYENWENILKGAICAVFLLLLLLLQTTFFVRFAPFGAIPDLLLSLTVAVAISEGERFGAVMGLFCAFFSQALGGVGPALLPLLYMPAGFFCGILARHYLRDSIPVRGIYIVACGAGRAIVTAITAAVVLHASAAQIFFDKVFPEFFSTAVAAPFVYGIIYLCLRPFHKSRAERTGE